jgi:SAM-dependent methyltransferase
MENKDTDLLAEVADYYSAMLATHGDTPRGVDWNGPESQLLRFEQLLKVIRQPRNFSVQDLGCGYGALYDYLDARFPEMTYHGCDISKEMIQAARARFAGRPNASFTVASAPSEVAGYCLASGIFNVRLGHSDSAWQEYIKSTLDTLNCNSRCGFAFNCLTSYSDADKMKANLYYADPCILFDHCKRRYSRNIALLHDYGLYEFTIIVRK